MQTIFTYNGTDRKVQFEIEKRVGKSFSLIEKIKMGGNGSPQLFVKSTSNSVKPYFKQSADRKFVNIELRKKGILLYLKNESNDFIAAFPFSKLVFKREDETIAISCDDFAFILENKSTKNHNKFWSKFLKFSALPQH